MKVTLRINKSELETLINAIETQLDHFNYCASISENESEKECFLKEVNNSKILLTQINN